MSAVNFRPNPHFEKFIEDLLESGRYSNKTEIMHAALRSLEDIEKLRKIRLQEMQEAIAKGDADIEAGRVTTYSSPKELTDKIKQRGRKRLAEKQNSR